MSEGEIRQELAVTLYSRGKLTMAQAARLSGLPQLEFQLLSSSRGYCVNYDVEDFQADIATLKGMGRL